MFGGQTMNLTTSITDGEITVTDIHPIALTDAAHIARDIALAANRELHPAETD